jgi:single-strand DNA-binding protein
MNLNKVFLIGRLTRDPESRSLPSGQQVTSFGLATDRFYTDKSGQKQQQTEFHNVVFFGKQAEIASQYLTKGALTMIEGRLQTRNWKDSSGNTKYRTEIIGERLQLGPKSSGGGKSYPNKRQDSPEPTRDEPQPEPQEEIPVIEEGEINIKDIPF